MNPNGVFHPKVYLFEHGNGQWDCVVGSPNFTHAAFTQNDEVAVHFSERDLDAAKIYRKLTKTLDRYRKLGGTIDAAELDAYRKVWKRQQKRIAPLSGTYEQKPIGKKPARSPLEVALFKESWSQYFRTIKEDPHDTTEVRLAVLEGARELFERHDSFGDMTKEQRRGIAGLLSTEDLDWGWFGSMKPQGQFQRAINENNTEISAALDHIPLEGDIGRDRFEAYAERFASAFEKSGIATATRLLALKRPDYFVCLDSKNKKALCKAFGISQNVSLENYWPKVIERILDSNWWNSREPRGGLERRVWRCRTAFLDVRFYEPK
jgi:hypothetical protein